MKRHIPNLFTLGNLTCGLLAINEILVNERLDLAAYWILGGLFFDFLDGLIARMLKVSGELGKQLDSLADMVTFGVVPGFIAFVLLEENGFPYPYLGFLITLFSALRLAKFNLDTRQSDSFIGVPTPANTMIWMSIPAIIGSNSELFSSIFQNPIFLAVLVVALSLLLTAELPLLALKFKNLSWGSNKVRWVFLGVSLPLLIILGVTYNNIFFPLPFIILLYILISLIDTKFIKKDKLSSDAKK